MDRAVGYLDVVLKDDRTPTGGLSHIGETLREFLDSINVSYRTPMKDVNDYLVANGIEPIKTKRQK